MQDVVDSVKRVSDITCEITTASHEHAAGIEQINQAVAQMDQVTQQNASLVEEAAPASESMRTEAKHLAETVAVFKVGTAQVPSQTCADNDRGSINAPSDDTQSAHVKSRQRAGAADSRNRNGC